MIKPDLLLLLLLLPTILLSININNLLPVKSLKSLPTTSLPDVLPTPNAHFCGLGSPNPQILVRKCRPQNPQGQCARAARNLTKGVPQIGPRFRFLVLFGGRKLVRPASLIPMKRRTILTFDASKVQNVLSLLHHFEVSMAYARSCFWAFAAVFWCGRASFQGLHQKVCCVCVCAQAASVHVRACAHLCVYVGV